MRAKFAAVGVPGPAEAAVPAGATGSRPCRSLAALVVVVVLTAFAAGCADIRPTAPESTGHIAAAPKPRPEVEKAIPPPARVSTFVPPPKPALKPQTYSVVVNEVPVKELLLALSRDTRQNIDIHPGLQGVVSLNAINETLPAILDRIAKQVNMRFRLEGNTIIVMPDTPYLKTYRVGYVNMTRDTTSTIGVSGELTVGASGGGSGSAQATSGGAMGGAGGSSTVVRTVSQNNFWEQLRDNIRAILASTRARSLSADEKAALDEERRKAADTALKQAEAVARAGQGAMPLFTAAFRGAAAQPQQVDVRDDVIANPVSGTVSVLATERQHQLVLQHLDSITTASQRQVLIEATIVEVQLSQAYQAGVDWNRISTSGGIAFTQALLGSNLATAPFFALFYNQANQRENHISLTIKLLEQFGQTRVLSSPKLMALNNQTALLKVVDNVVYFELQAQTNTTQGVATTTFNSTPRFVSVGVVMGVTPQINDDGRVALNVRPTVSRVLRFVNDPNPSLVVGGQQIQNPVPQIQIREMESVLQVGSGQTVILGGLMQNEAQRNRDQVPVAGSQPQLGDLFAFRDESASKTELVIFLRTTVVPNPSLESDELKFFRRFLPQAETPQEKPRPAQ